jgi:hypothetical protein
VAAVHNLSALPIGISMRNRLILAVVTLVLALLLVRWFARHPAAVAVAPPTTEPVVVMKKTPAPAPEPAPAAVAQVAPTARPPVVPSPVKEPDKVEKPDDLLENTFLDPVYNLAGKLPPGWTMRQSMRWGEKQNTLFFHDEDHPKTVPSIYYKVYDQPMTLAGDEIDAWMRKTVEDKTQQRIAGGMSDYVVRPEIISTTIDGRPAMIWTADFTANGQQMTEYLTRIYSPNATVLLFTRGPTDQIEAAKPAYQQLMETIILP